MSKLEIDLNKIGNLQAEIKILESRKLEIERGADKIRTEVIKEKRQGEQDLAKQKEDFKNEIRLREKGFKKIEKDLTYQTVDLRKKEQEGRDLDKDIQAFNKKKRSFTDKRKAIQDLKSNYIDREHKANLLITQYKKMIGELPQDKVVKKDKEVKKEAKKTTKKKR
ncbi:hypothetical protein LCGC14_2372200 [marine sediment metagenome]|uniref:Uncharacterized protein n=1 Tax=marine sediment metagenome TaxID=412755 RepID=A0A0F9CQR0_9ZZZZ